MHVDRSRFLLLTASIAAGSCAPSPTPRSPEDGEKLEVVPPSIAIDPTTDEPLPNEAYAEPATDLGEPMDHDARLVERLSETCHGLEPPPGPHCESFHSTKNECEVLARALQPDAAERAVHCLVAKSDSQQICTYEAAGLCLIVGSLTVHPEPDTSTPCQSILSNCGGGRRGHELNTMTCRTVLSAIRSDRRSSLVSCMNESCTVSGCLYDIDTR